MTPVLKLMKMAIEMPRVTAVPASDHQQHDSFVGPRFLVHLAALEMHPLDTADRVGDLKEQHGIGFCNITKCCTKVCPEHITITDNAIIPLKERVVDEFYDPVQKLLQLIWPRKKGQLRKDEG